MRLTSNTSNSSSSITEESALTLESSNLNVIGDRVLSGDEVRAQLRQYLQDCRALTLKLFGTVDSQTLCYQSHSDFSPIGWHLGHIAMTESMWLLERGAGQADSHPHLRRLLLADGLPKSDRCQLPSLAELLDYLADVRDRTLNQLDNADLTGANKRLWYFILQHECQHAETASLVLALQRQPELVAGTAIASKAVSEGIAPIHGESIEIPAGEFEMGCDRPLALDNERPSHRVNVPTFHIDRYPVTQRQFAAFIAAGGYTHRDWWSDEGWNWLQSQAVTAPRYWRRGDEFNDHPVCGVSYYEAEAYAAFAGKRLPTETEWEKAASLDATKQGNSQGLVGLKGHGNLAHNLRSSSTTPVTAFSDHTSRYGCVDTIGNVWEWTSSWFDGYPGFEWFPYPGYSKTYFDRQHRVLKGGSWATYPWAIRSSFRNWYHPWMRQMFAGFRCAWDGSH